MKISKNQKPMSPNYPLHQRRNWQSDESRERDEQNSHSYWNLTCSKSQTTCKERDSPLSSANSYISDNASSPWALSRTSRHTDILWLYFFFFFREKLFSLSHLFCASRLSAVCIVEDQQSIARRRATHTVDKHILTHKRRRLRRTPCLLLRGCGAMWGERWRDISPGIWSGADARPQPCPLGSAPSVVMSAGWNSPTIQTISRSHTPQLS